MHLFDPADLTLAKNTIHNPDEPRHYMKLTPVNRASPFAVGIVS